MRITRIGVVGVAVAAMLAGGVGLAGAATSGPSVSGTEHFNLMTTQNSASKYVVIASGLFTAGGVDVSGTATDTVKFAHGTFKIHHGTTFRIITQKLNPLTCLANFKAIAKFTLGNGTGEFRKISGSGSATVVELAIFPRNKKGACNPNANPVVNEQTITASAKVKL